MHYGNTNEQKRFIISRELANEFETVYDFKERLTRVPLENIHNILNKFNIENEIAKAIYILALENKLTEEEANNNILWIRKIYEENGESIPKISTYLLNFAAKEGSWLFYLYGKYTHFIEEKTREILNLEYSIKFDSDKSVEKIVNIVNSRRNLIDTVIGPLIEKWLNEHEKFNKMQSLRALLAPILKISPQEVDSYLTPAHNKTRALFFELDRLLEKDNLIDEGIITKKQILQIRANLLSELNQMSIETLSQIFLEVIPRKEIKPDKENRSSMLIVSSPITRNGLVGPVLKTPYDFLERDLKIARMRDKSERIDFINIRLKKVFMNLNTKINDYMKIAIRIINNMNKRFSLRTLNSKKIETTLYNLYFGQEEFKELLKKIERDVKTQLGKQKILQKDIWERFKILYPIPKQDMLKILSEYFSSNFYGDSDA